MTARQSIERVEQLIAEMDATSRDIERRGKLAARHLRSAATNGSAATERAPRSIRVRVVSDTGAAEPGR